MGCWRNEYTPAARTAAVSPSTSHRSRMAASISRAIMVHP